MPDADIPVRSAPRRALLAFALGALASCDSGGEDAGGSAGATPPARAALPGRVLGFERWQVRQAPGPIFDEAVQSLAASDRVQISGEEIASRYWRLFADAPGEKALRVWVAGPHLPVLAGAGPEVPGARLVLSHRAHELHRAGPDPRALAADSYCFLDGQIYLALHREQGPPGAGYQVSYPAAARSVFGPLLGCLRGAPPTLRSQPLAFGMETRRGIILPPPGAVATTLDVPPGARLHLGFGLSGAPGWEALGGALHEVAARGDGVGFRLSLVDSGRLEKIVWQRFVGPEERDVFFDAHISLAPWAGQRVELVLATYGSPPHPGGRADARDDCAYLCEPFLDATPAAAAPDVLIVLLDTLRADALGCYGNPRALTPTLDALAREGWLFRQARSSCSWTLPAHASLFTSLLPTQHGLLSGDRRLQPGFPTIAEALAGAGWRTAAFTGGGFVSATYGLDAGFQRFDARGGGFETVLARAQRWLADTRGPAFAFIHTYAMHIPYDPPQPFRSRWVRAYAGALPAAVSHEHITRPGSHVPRKLAPADLRYLRDLYEAEASYCDHCLAGLFESIRSSGRWDETLLVVTSDHGEEFGEHGGFEHGTTLYEEVLRIPLLVRYPGFYEGGHVAAHRARLVDIAPTILEALDLAQPRTWVGASLRREDAHRDLLPAFADDGGHAVYAEDSARKWIHIPSGRYLNGREVRGELFDLERDPGEQHNLWSAQSDARFEPLLRALLARYPQQRPGRGAPAALSIEERAFLRGIGYLR